jgi:hypothetical protein
LRRARPFAEATDSPTRAPAGFNYHLVVGDSEDIAKTVRIDAGGSVTVVKQGPGDGAMLYSSALLDERRAVNRHSRRVSPISWNHVMFLLSNHQNMTNDPFFSDNLLFILLKKTRPSEPRVHSPRK